MIEDSDYLLPHVKYICVKNQFPPFSIPPLFPQKVTNKERSRQMCNRGHPTWHTLSSLSGTLPPSIGEAHCDDNMF